MQECFSNAAELTSNDRTCSYAEGFAASGEMSPFIHAWCVRRGLAADPTLKNPRSYAYLGIIIPREMVFAALKKQGHYGVLTGSMGPEFMASWDTAHPQ